MGIEPTFVAWEATVLPLNYTRTGRRFYSRLPRGGNCPGGGGAFVRFDLRDLELFVAVAEAGSIARAADRAHTVASAISKRISDLEDNFGTALLVRGAKGVELTATGHALLARARVLLHQASQLENEMHRHASGAHGYVRVFANISAIVEFLPRALASFAAAYPEIHVHLEEHVSSETGHRQRAAGHRRLDDAAVSHR